MELRRVIIVLLRRWWLVVGLPIVVLVGTQIASSTQPYTATVRASILIPGDTEIPGDSERPELMVLDDAPSVIASQAFAEAVQAELDNTNGSAQTLTADDVHDSLSSQRYSRVLTITVKRDDASEALAIGQAVAAALPDAVNTFMVADSAPQATVQIMDRPEEALRDAQSRRLVMIVQTLVALAAGAGLAALAAALDERLYSETVASALGLPILADVRSGRRRWPDFRFARGGRA